MFRVSSTHLQEDIVVHKQHMVPSLSIRVLVSCWYAAIGRTVLPIAAYQQATRNSYREGRYHMLLVYNYVLLKMSTWYPKHVEESNNIWWKNNIQCITLVVLYDHVICKSSNALIPSYQASWRHIPETVGSLHCYANRRSKMWVKNGSELVLWQTSFSDIMSLISITIPFTGKLARVTHYSD